jgi:glycosyltransferase involved in cell wall biosynthesis
LRKGFGKYPPLQGRYIRKGIVLETCAGEDKKKNWIPQLVSVGIPTYNRPKELRKALECITAQTYTNLEIIVSDNCSPGKETEEVVQEFIKKDRRVSYYRQQENHGPVFNMNFVLERSNGVYFMWAADDDRFEKNFIEVCFDQFISESDVVAVTTEAQYFSDDKKFEFFSEGEPFYSFTSKNAEERLLYLLKYGYGNLFYSIFHRQVLVESGKGVYSRLSMTGLNEIPLFLLVIEHGNWRVIPRIGFFKKTVETVYIQARWEMTGGFLKGSGFLRFFGQLKADFFYHYHSLIDIMRAISLLHIRNKRKIVLFAVWSLGEHFILLTLHYKPRVRHTFESEKNQLRNEQLH